ncbi:MAG: acetyl-CoA C-acetyltransferase [Syntrophaceae bacterium]|nr:MAG: acetyl-CoA C-acetyltransferase [Syntrophaceae bacterium]
MSSSPVIIGVAQFTQAKKTERPLDPLGLMVKTSQDALSDAGAARLKDVIDCVYVMNLFQWSYRDAPGQLSARLGLKPRQASYLPVGGNTPQLLVNKAARDLAAGRCKAVLMTGAEAIYSLRRASKGDIVLDWPESVPPDRIDGENTNGVDKIEELYDLFFPSFMYPLFETSLRASSGRTPEEHQMYMGKSFEYLSRIASQNPLAWSRQALSAQVIATPAPDNRYVGYPYTKYMNANVDVDQSAAVIMTTEDSARSLGIPEDKWVYPIGGADFNDIWYVTRRPCLHESPAIRHAARIALEQADLTLGDIDVFDLYSCFPSAFEIARREIGIPKNDRRDLSVTGGLPFFGGPGNNYSMHAIAAVVERIRKDRSRKAMVTANGWYLTKHAIGVYAGSPSGQLWDDRDDSPVQRSINAEALPMPVEKASGSLTVEAYVIQHDKAGKPMKGTVVGRLEDGGRTLAVIDAGPEELLQMEKVELVGKQGDVRYDQATGKNMARFNMKV